MTKKITEVNFNDNYKLVYQEEVYPDCIKFHDMNGVLITLGSWSLVKDIRKLLVDKGYEVEVLK